MAHIKQGERGTVPIISTHTLCQFAHGKQGCRCAKMADGRYCERTKLELRNLLIIVLGDEKSADLVMTGPVTVSRKKAPKKAAPKGGAK